MDRRESTTTATTASDVAAAIRAAFRVPSDSEIVPGDAPALARTYRGMMEEYRQHGRQYLAEGDYRQAAEKSWGAFAESVKSIAADYAMKISFHGTIISVASRLATLAAQDDPRCRIDCPAGTRVKLARSLHQHFYENDLEPEVINLAADDVAAAIDLMQQRFASQAPTEAGRPPSANPNRRHLYRRRGLRRVGAARA